MRGADVEDVMTSDVIVCRGDETLEQAAGRLAQADLTSAPVVDRESRRLVGIVSVRDICAAIVEQGEAAGVRLVGSVMREKVASCWPDDSLESAEAIMRAYRVHQLPVVDTAGTLVGMVCLSDLALHAERLADAERARGEVAGVVETLAAISGDPS